MVPSFCHGSLGVWNLARRAYLWAAGVVAIGEAANFLESVRDLCSDQSIVTWCSWPMKLLDMGRMVKTLSWFSKLKRRINQYNTYFPTNRPKIAER